MKKTLQLLLSCFFLIFIMLLLGGCGSSKSSSTTLSDYLRPNEFSTTSSNSVIHQAQADAPENTLLYIINDPSEAEMDEILTYQRLRIDTCDSCVLLVPRRQESIMKIYLLEETEQAGAYERTGEALWGTDDSSKGLIVAAEMQRGPNGQPKYEIYIETKDYYASYFFELPAEGEELPHFEYVQNQGQTLKLNSLD